MSKVDRDNVEDILPLTPTQTGLLYHYIREPGGDQYLVQLSLRLRGPVDREKFTQVWTEVVEANELLRVVFRWEEIRPPVQIVLRSSPPAISYLDFSDLTCEEQDKALAEFKRADRSAGMDLKRVAFRIALLKLKSECYEAIVTYHNIICDGWSVAVVVDEFLTAYNQLAKGQRPKIATKATFKEFLKWQRSPDSEADLNYWIEALRGVEAQAPININVTNEHAGPVAFAGVTEIVPDELARAAQKLSQEQRVTLSATLYTAWAVLLARYTDSEDVVFGTTVAGRPARLAGIERTVGLFINTPPLRVTMASDDRLVDVLGRVSETLARRYDHEWTSAVDIQRAGRLAAGEALFNSIVVVENYPISYPDKTDQALAIESYSFAEATHYDLTLIIRTFDGLTLDLSYRPDQMDAASARRLLYHYLNLLRQFVEKPAVRLDQVEMLDESEQRQIIAALRGPQRPLVAEKTIVELFDNTAGAYRDRIAVVCGEKEITYEELQRRVNSFALQLRQENVKPGSLVALMADRSIEMIVAILGIMKAGAAYVPLSRAHPVSRTDAMLQDSGAELLVLLGTLPPDLNYRGRIVNIEEHTDELAAGDWTTPLPDQPAYVIYTSGSTGVPKGVVVSHHAVVNLLTWIKTTFQFGAGDVVLQSTPITFDVSVWELFAWMSGGSRLCLLKPDGEKDPAAIIDAVNRHKVTAVHFVPTMLPPFLDYVDAYGLAVDLQSLRLVFSSGEPLRGRTVERFWGVLGQNEKLHYFNLYGPTETTVWTSSYECARKDVGPGIVPIGKPIDNTSYFIRGRWGQLQPSGVWGELCIAGDCLANGYLNQPASIRFGRSGERVYRTGDVARARQDGVVEFCCRRDRQIKIRGHRIEPGEIEAALLALEGIDSAIVMAYNGAGESPELWAYYTSRQAYDEADIKSFLAKRLPAPMMPEHLLRLDAIPRNANGKIDLKQLPVCQTAPPTAERGHPGELCENIISVWADVLSLPEKSIGPDDNFFQLGGNSLTAVNLIAALYRRLSINLQLSAVFDNPTPRELAKVVESAARTRPTEIPKAESREYYDLSYNQKRLWILQQMRPETAAYNLVGSIELYEAADPGTISAAINSLIQRHDSLRTRIVTLRNAPVQIVEERGNARVTVRDLSALSPTEQENARREFLLGESSAPFDLARSPLLRTTLLKLGKNHYELVVNMPHIISDGWSLELLKDEFEQILYGGRTSQLPPPSLQYKDYVVWQNRLLRDDSRVREPREFLRSIVEPEPAPLALPEDYPAPAVDSRRSAAYRIVVPQTLTQRLRVWAQQRRIGLFLPLAGALQLTMAQLTGQDDIVIGFVAAARQHESLHSTMGMFANSLLLRSRVDRGQPVIGFLDQLQAQLLRNLEYQSFPAELLCEQMRIKCPQPAVFLNLLNIGRDHREPLHDFAPAHIPEIQESKFPLHYCVREFRNGIEIVCDYYSQRFSRRTIERKMDLYVHYLSKIVEASDETIRDISLVTDTQHLKRVPAFVQV
jgi:amino acid adenylation domain-containing protein